jgi:hypothetical protein
MAGFVLSRPRDNFCPTVLTSNSLVDEYEPHYAKDQRCQADTDGQQQKGGGLKLGLSHLHGCLRSLTAFFRHHARSPLAPTIRVPRIPFLTGSEA